MSDIAIRAIDLSKQYRIGAKQKGGARLSEVLSNAIVSPVAEFRKLARPVDPSELIWALKGVSFEAEQGETIGIIGRNGAGKSTLLKVLARITNPTEGRAELYGRVGALLEVGTGFHPDLTGRENIYLKGAMLGMRRQEITRKLDDIVAFAELETFLDTPVKRYSSGMGMRLAFAVSAHLDAEIMIVDEILAVGDIAFQNKCIGKMDEVTQGGRTVLFVSHNMGAISRLCTRTLWMDNGEIVVDGDTKDVIAHYLTTSASQEGEHIWPEGLSRRDVSDFKLRAMRIINQNGEITSAVGITEPFIVEIEYEVLKRMPYCRVGFEMENTSGVTVFQTFDTDDKRYTGEVSPGRYTTRCRVPAPLLNTGYYSLKVSADIPQRRRLAAADNVVSCQIVDNNSDGSRMNTKHRGVVHAEFQWTRERLR